NVFPTVLTSVVAALLLTVLYVYAVYWRFKSAKELWAFQIHFSFLTNKVSVLLFLAAVLVYFYGQAYWDIAYVRASMFSVAFAVSTAAVVGVFTADAFMDKYQIKKSHSRKTDQATAGRDSMRALSFVLAVSTLLSG